MTLYITCGATKTRGWHSTIPRTSIFVHGQILSQKSMSRNKQVKSQSPLYKIQQVKGQLVK